MLSHVPCPGLAVASLYGEHEGARHATGCPLLPDIAGHLSAQEHFSVGKKKSALKNCVGI